MVNLFGNSNSNDDGQLGQLHSTIGTFNGQATNVSKPIAEDTLRREAGTREHFQHALYTRGHSSQGMARGKLAVASHMQHVTTAVAKLRGHMTAQADFTVGAVQQVRDEVVGGHNDGAIHAGRTPRLNFFSQQQSCETTSVKKHSWTFVK